MSSTILQMTQKISMALIFVAGCILGLASPAQAADNDTMALVGFSARENSYYGYAGLTHNFSGNLLEDGVLGELVGYGGQYDYNSTAVPGGQVDARYTAFDALIGYQKVLTSYTLRGYVGVEYEGHHLSPSNSFDSNRGYHVGGKVRGEFETDYASPNYAHVIATYGSATDRYWVRARAGRDFAGYVVGPEVLGTGDREYDEQRLGAFVAFRNILPAMFSISAGYAHMGEARGGSSPYVTMELSTTF